MKPLTCALAEFSLFHFLLQNCRCHLPNHFAFCNFYLLPAPQASLWYSQATCLYYGEGRWITVKLYQIIQEAFFTLSAKQGLRKG